MAKIIFQTGEVFEFPNEDKSKAYGVMISWRSQQALIMRKTKDRMWVLERSGVPTSAVPTIYESVPIEVKIAAEAVRIVLRFKS